MPWERQGKAVHRKGSSKPIKGGIHKTAAQAEAHLKALYANYKPKGKKP